ncbi:hypothetical protein SERLADRAFT_408347 [Serpula lacrymans var. lacrymans S7.9]|uniref:Uncharacterized protein n=1 Tax=Serpula lacrymans var. lacrymans (strain S7.9) TaxID=578457 RepID=F8NWG6_SERL9|nr:uncharacterized protein SERLADRAFT_408347 [Serpula lacrymans var. lacrymans S7.9]EGO24370.1 hypothetical protein SERLADRAFT_408347 [Serpula lacrymans var. lacrymans S7.9]
MISSKEWTAIKATARVTQNKLEQLPLPKSIIQEVEQQQPLLALCSNHWKAEHVLGQMLRSTTTMKTQLSLLSRQEQEQEWEWEQEREREQKLKNNVEQGQVSRKRRRNNGQFSVPIQKSLPPPSFLSVSSDKGSKKYNVDFIEVSSSILDLKTIITRNFDSNSFGINLLNAMELSTDFSPGPPSSLMLKFIERIERADPNSPEFDEDDHGVSWGHHQFTSGSMTSSSVLTSWTAIGKDFALDLSLTFLADNYLNNILEQIWAAWKAAGGPVSKGKWPPLSRQWNNPQWVCQIWPDLVTVILALPIKKQPSKVEVESIMSKAMEGKECNIQIQEGDSVDADAGFQLPPPRYIPDVGA